MTTLSWYLQAAVEARGSGAWERAIGSYEASLRRVPAEGDATVAAEILRGIGNVHYSRGDFDEAREVFMASLAIAEANALEEQAGAALNCLGAVEQFAGAPGEAEALYLRARDIAAARGDERRAAMIEQNLATLASVAGLPELALRRYEAAHARFVKLGDERAAARVLQNMGMAYVDLENWAAAERAFDEAARVALALGEPETLATVAVNRTELHLRRGRLEEARECCDLAMELFGGVHSKAGMAESCKFSGVIYRELGSAQLAEAQLDLAVGLARICGDRLLEAEVERERGVLHIHLGRGAEARRALDRARSLFGEMRAAREALDVEARLAALPLH